MVVRKISKDGWCAVCDERFAEVEISHEGTLRPFWFHPTDGEICLCRNCFNEMKKLINEFKFDDDKDK